MTQKKKSETGKENNRKNNFSSNDEINKAPVKAVIKPEKAAEAEISSEGEKLSDDGRKSLTPSEDVTASSPQTPKRQRREPEWKLRINQEDKEEKDSRLKSGISRYFDIAAVSFLVVAACLLFYFVLFRFDVIKKGIGVILSVTSPIIVGFIFAYLLNPVVMLLEAKFLKIYRKHQDAMAKAGKKKKPHKHRAESDDNPICTNQNPVLVNGRGGARRLAITVTVLVTVTLSGLLIMVVVPAFVRSISALAENLPQYYTAISEKIIDFVEKHEKISKQLPDINEILNKINVFDIVSNYLNSVLSTAYNWVIIAFKFVYNVVIGLIIAIYLLGGKERYIGQAKKVCFAVMKPVRAKRFIQNMHKTNGIFKSAILGKILDSIIIGCICFIGMSVIGMLGFSVIEDNKVLISVVVGVTNVIPFFGPYIGGIPSVFLLLCLNPLQGLIFAVFIIVLQQFDCNFLDPRVVGRSVGLSPFYVIVSCLICGGLLGIPGMLIATPFGAVVYGISKAWIESKLESKSLPIDTFEYADKPGAVILKKSEE